MCKQEHDKGSRYANTASPLTPWIYGILDFCNIRVNLDYSLVFIVFKTRFNSTPLPAGVFTRCLSNGLAGLPAGFVAGFAPRHVSPTLLERILRWYLLPYPLGGYTGPAQFCLAQKYPLDEQYSNHPTPMDATIPNPGPRRGSGMHRCGATMSFALICPGKARRIQGSQLNDLDRSNNGN